MGQIAQAQIGAPCYPFTGRGLELRGFVMRGMEKSYLTSTRTNIDSEKGVLSLFNYDLAEGAFNSSADRASLLIYTVAGAYAASITTGRILTGLDVLMQMDNDYAVTTNKRNASIRGARIQAYGHNNVDGSVTGLRATAQLKATYTFLGRIVENSSSYGGIGLDVRMETTGTGTVVIGDGTVIGTQYGFAGVLITYKGSNALTGNVHYIVMNIPYEGGAVSGETVGIKFVNQVVFTGTAFDKGIDFGTSMVVKAINVDACSVFADADVTLATADSAMEIIVTSSGAVSAGYIQALQLTMNHSTGALTGSSELHVLALDTTLTGGSSRGVPYWYAQTIYLSSSDNPVVTGVAAISVYIDTLGNAIVNLNVLDMGVAQTDAVSGRFNFIRCYRGSGQTPDSIIRAEATAATNLISVDSSGGGFLEVVAPSLSLTITHKIAVDINGVTRYIAVGTIA